MEFHISIEGKTEGPLTEDDVRTRIVAGRLRPVDHCWAAGWDAWRPVRDVFPDAVEELQMATLPTWNAVIARPPDEAADLRRKLPVRQDRTSGALFLGLGSVAAVGLILGAIWFFGGGARPDASGEKPALSKGRQAAERRAALEAGTANGPVLKERLFSGTNLQQIAQGCLAYAKAHDGNLPTFCEDLRPLFGDRLEDVLDVPETPERESAGYVLRMDITTSMPPETVIAFEARARPDGSRAVAYLNGKVRVLPAGDPELRRAIGR